jgi:hypothetical protein
MTDDLKGRALRAAAAVIAEVDEPTSERLVTMLAAAWAEGYGAGLADALAVSENVVRLAARVEIAE